MHPVDFWFLGLAFFLLGGYGVFNGWCRVRRGHLVHRAEFLAMSAMSVAGALIMLAAGLTAPSP